MAVITLYVAVKHQTMVIGNQETQRWQECAPQDLHLIQSLSSEEEEHGMSDRHAR